MELEKATFKQGEKIYVYLILKNNKDVIVYLDEKGFDLEIYSLEENVRWDYNYKRF